MQTITFNLYTFDELTDERAKERARDWCRNNLDFPWFDEYRESLKAFCEKFSIRLTDYHLSNDYRAEVVTDAMPSHFRGVKVKHIDREEMLTGFCADSSLMYEFHDQFKQTGNALEAFNSALNVFLLDLRKDIDSIYKADYIDEHLEINGYTFTEDGERFEA